MTARAVPTPAGLPFARSKAAQKWRRTRGSTRRLALLGGIVVLLAVMLVPTLRAYLAQRDEYAALADQVGRQEQSVQQLTDEEKRWQDPAYVEQQARERLKYVKKGETAYQIVGRSSATGPATGRTVVVDPDGARQPWYAEVWTSITMTDSGGDQPDAAQTPAVDPAP